MKSFYFSPWVSLTEEYIGPTSEYLHKCIQGKLCQDVVSIVLAYLDLTELTFFRYLDYLGRQGMINRSSLYAPELTYDFRGMLGEYWINYISEATDEFSIQYSFPSIWTLSSDLEYKADFRGIFDIPDVPDEVYAYIKDYFGTDDAHLLDFFIQ